MFAISPNRIIGILVLLAVFFVLFGEFVHLPGLIYVFKPLATILILAISLRHWRQQHSVYPLFISVGLFFSLLGDIALIFPAQFFQQGLLFFLITHVAYLVAFSLHVRFFARPFMWFFYLAFGAALYAFLFPNLPAGLKISVAFYSLLLTSMAAQAMGRFLILKTQPTRFAAIGALFFMLSDSLLSLDRFHAHLPAVAFFVLIPYYLAQWLIALSTLPASPTSPMKRTPCGASPIMDH